MMISDIVWDLFCIFTEFDFTWFEFDFFKEAHSFNDD